MESVPFDHCFEVRLEFLDGRVISPTKHWTVQDAMADAEEYSSVQNVQGGIWYVGAPGEDPVEVIVYNADGSIEVGDDIDALSEDL